MNAYLNATEIPPAYVTRFAGERNDVQPNGWVTHPVEVDSFLKPTCELDLNAKIKLGANGVDRFDEFVRYRAGWDFGSGEPLSPHSIAMMLWFLNVHGDAVWGTPSLFMLTEGYLQLMWKEPSGEAIVVDFLPDAIGLYRERGEVEVVLRKDDPGIIHVLATA